jgi:hypothetical protein
MSLKLPFSVYITKIISQIILVTAHYDYKSKAYACVENEKPRADLKTARGREKNGNETGF